jgi:purine catabolism regulator
MHIHRALTRTASLALGVGALAMTLSQLVQRPVAVFDRSLRVIAGDDALARAALRAVPGIDSPRAQGVARLREEVAGQNPREFSVIAIELGDETAGHLIVDEEGKPLDPIDRKAMEQAATIFAVEFLRERSAFEAERRTAGDALGRLFDGDTAAGDATGLLKSLGLPAIGPWRVIRFAVSRETDGVRLPPDAQHRALFSDALRQRGIETPLLPWREGFVTVLADADWQRLVPAASGRSVAPGARAWPTALPTWVGAGRAEAEVRDLRWSLDGAEQALLAAQRLGIRDRVLPFEELGVLRLLLSANAREDHAAFVEQVLGPVRTADARGRAPVLMRTLQALVAEDFRLPQTARALDVHLNTAKYRLRRLSELLGGDPARGERRLEIELALRLAQMLRPTGAVQGAFSGNSGSGRS